VLQEKLSKIQLYWPQIHNGETISEIDALTLTQDPDKAKRFFLDCSIEVSGCVWNWTTAKDDGENEAYFNLILPIIRQL
jgi:hypothetical protein